MKQNIIIFGGTFDPIHNGHMRVAEHAIERLKGDKLVFVPAKRSPHKQVAPFASGRDRIEMIRRAIGEAARFAVNDCEIKREEPSYTIDTIRFFRGVYGPDAQLFLLVGADGLKDLSRWYKIEQLLDECMVCLMVRPGLPVPDTQAFQNVFSSKHIEKIRSRILSNPLVNISSTQIRKLVSERGDISSLVPAAVCEYIRTHDLYR